MNKFVYIKSIRFQRLSVTVQRWKIKLLFRDYTALKRSLRVIKITVVVAVVVVMIMINYSSSDRSGSGGSGSSCSGSSGSSSSSNNQCFWLKNGCRY